MRIKKDRGVLFLISIVNTNGENLKFSNNNYFHYFYKMSTILIKADKKSNKILSELAKKLGGEVIDMNDEQFEDLMLGTLMENVKTGKTVSKSVILKKLKT